MKKRHFLTIAVILIFSIVAVTPSSWAGSPQSYRWEGVAIGIGAAILGKALLDQHRRAVVVESPQPAVVEYRHHPVPPEPSGYWEMRKEWIPAEYRKVWNPGHFNRHGRKVRGHWMQVEVQPGHWVTRQVWIPYN